MAHPIQESEPRRSPRRNYELVDRVAERIRPDDAALGDWFTTYHARHRGRIVADLHLVERHVPADAKILECGAIPLLATGALVELGYRVSAVDIAPRRFAAAIDALGLTVEACDIEREPLPFPDDTFDAVIFNELFEHLRINPIETMQQVRRVLAPGGTLLLSTPNLRSFRGLRNLLQHHRGQTGSGGVYDQYEKLETLGHMGHVREYTSRDVSEFLERVGFRVETVVYRGGYGKGLVGLAERLAPSMRPFFSLVAAKVEDSR